MNLKNGDKMATILPETIIKLMKKAFPQKRPLFYWKEYRIKTLSYPRWYYTNVA